MAKTKSAEVKKVGVMVQLLSERRKLVARLAELESKELSAFVPATFPPVYDALVRQSRT